MNSGAFDILMAMLIEFKEGNYISINNYSIWKCFHFLCLFTSSFPISLWGVVYCLLTKHELFTYPSSVKSINKIWKWSFFHFSYVFSILSGQSQLLFIISWAFIIIYFFIVRYGRTAIGYVWQFYRFTCSMLRRQLTNMCSALKKKIENENWEKQFLLVDTISFLFRRSSFGTNFSSKNVLNWLESSWITMSININQKKKLLHSWFSFVLDESHWAIELH